MFSCFVPLLSKVERICHVIVVSSYLASSDGYIGSTILAGFSINALLD